jgi:hypothetical protein
MCRSDIHAKVHTLGFVSGIFQLELPHMSTVQKEENKGRRQYGKTDYYPSVMYTPVKSG